jgi:glycosyltransferase involved in cell wall biosynthesis
MNIKFSVIIPSFNSSATIEKCLDSVLLQSDFDLPVEIIIVDDASCDNTIGIVEQKLAHIPKNLSYVIIVNDSNRGASFTRNEGISVARGEYILFLDSDDFYHESKFRQINYALSGDVDFMFHDFTYSFRNESFADKSRQKPRRLPKYFKYFNLIKNNICTPCVAIKRSAVQNFNTDLQRMEDLELWTRLMMSGVNTHYLSVPLVELGHELNKGSGLSSNNAAMRKSEKDMLRILSRRFIRLRFLYPVYILTHHLKKIRDQLRSIR